MKKYGAPLAFFLFIFFQLHAMEYDICHFNKLPVDVLNLIAQFLTCDDETDEQFIARTRIIKELPLECKRLFDTVKVKCSGNWSFCPDETKLIATVHDTVNEYWQKSPVTYALMMVYIYKNSDKKMPDYKRIYHDIKEHKYRRVALSREGNLLATFYAEKECYEDEYLSEYVSQYVFKIEKVYEKKERRIDFSHRFHPDIIAFNKQGTHLVAHGKDLFTKEYRCHTFPLKIVDPDKPQEMVNPTNKLQQYLRDKFVCNQYIEGKR